MVAAPPAVDRIDEPTWNFLIALLQRIQTGDPIAVGRLLGLSATRLPNAQRLLIDEYLHQLLQSLVRRRFGQRPTPGELTQVADETLSSLQRIVPEATREAAANALLAEFDYPAQGKRLNILAVAPHVVLVLSGSLSSIDELRLDLDAWLSANAGALRARMPNEPRRRKPSREAVRVGGFKDHVWRRMCSVAVAANEGDIVTGAAAMNELARDVQPEDILRMKLYTWWLLSQAIKQRLNAETPSAEQVDELAVQIRPAVTRLAQVDATTLGRTLKMALNLIEPDATTGRRPALDGPFVVIGSVALGCILEDAETWLRHSYTALKVWHARLTRPRSPEQ